MLLSFSQVCNTRRAITLHTQPGSETHDPHQAHLIRPALTLPAIIEGFLNSSQSTLSVLTLTKRLLLLTCYRTAGRGQRTAAIPWYEKIFSRVSVCALVNLKSSHTAIHPPLAHLNGERHNNTLLTIHHYFRGNHSHVSRYVIQTQGDVRLRVRKE